MTLKANDRVIYKNDTNKEVYKVYAIYSKEYVSLGLLSYSDIEMDMLTHVKNLIKI